MTPTEYEKAKELAALWPECVDTRLAEKIRRLYALPAGGVASDRLQDYLAAARKRWPQMQIGTGGANYEAAWWCRLAMPGRTVFGAGDTDCERILAALLQAAKGEA